MALGSTSGRHPPLARETNLGARRDSATNPEHSTICAASLLRSGHQPSAPGGPRRRSSSTSNLVPPTKLASFFMIRVSLWSLCHLSPVSSCACPPRLYAAPLHTEGQTLTGNWSRPQYGMWPNGGLHKGSSPSSYVLVLYLCCSLPLPLYGLVSQELQCAGVRPRKLPRRHDVHAVVMRCGGPGTLSGSEVLRTSSKAHQAVCLGP